jgi:hypothetical protein
MKPLLSVSICSLLKQHFRRGRLTRPGPLAKHSVHLLPGCSHLPHSPAADLLTASPAARCNATIHFCSHLLPSKSSRLSTLYPGCRPLRRSYIPSTHIDSLLHSTRSTRYPRMTSLAARLHSLHSRLIHSPIAVELSTSGKWGSRQLQMQES